MGCNRDSSLRKLTGVRPVAIIPARLRPLPAGVVRPGFLSLSEAPVPLAALRSLIAAHTREILEMIGGGALIALVLVAINLQVVDPAFRAIEERQAVEDSDRAVADLEREI